MDRREFIKIAGLTTLVGAGATGAFQLLEPGAIDAATHEEHGHGPSAHGGVEEQEAKGPKVRWAMTIDVRKCEDPEVVKRIIAACHTAHNVPDFGNPKDSVKWIWTDTYEHAFPDTANEFMDKQIEHLPFLLLCNHCDDPPCVRVCPTKATFKRPDGVVAMDYHRCIGCRFCMAGCPYGSLSFNWRDPREFLDSMTINPNFPTRTRGVVEKCNFCVERIWKGLQPACVEAAPEVLTFGNLADPDSNVRQILRKRVSIRRKPELGTKPSVFYLV